MELDDYSVEDLAKKTLNQVISIGGSMNSGEAIRNAIEVAKGMCYAEKRYIEVIKILQSWEIKLVEAAINLNSVTPSHSHP